MLCDLLRLFLLSLILITCFETSFASNDTVAKKFVTAPSDGQHSISLATYSISPFLFMQHIAGSSSTAGDSGNSGPAVSAAVTVQIPWVAPDGKIYLPGGAATHKIRQISTSGIITHLGGSGTEWASGSATSGAIASINFYKPYGIVGNTNAVFYITDEYYVWRLQSG
jgi:hypothetical protein